VGEATARELHEEVRSERRIVYTTVTKVLDRLTAKGLVKRVRAGRAYRYRAAADQMTTQRRMVRGLVDQIARGGELQAIAALVGAIEDISPALLDELSEMVEAHRRRRDGA